MNVLVTGGGFLGTRITEMLLQRGDHVRVLSRRPLPELIKLGAETIQADIRNMDSVQNACTNMDAVIHTAAKTDLWGARKEFFEINARGTANVIQACLACGVERLVHTSSPSVVFNGATIENGDESLPVASRFLSPYPASKAVAEAMVLDANGWEMVRETVNPDAVDILQKYDSEVRQLATCVLRPHLIWGPRDPHFVPRLLDAAAKRRIRRVGNGDNRVSITYIDNAAMAHLLALDRLRIDSPIAGQAYFINDPDPVNLWDWVDDLIRKLGKSPPRNAMSYRTAYRLGALLEIAHRLIPSLGAPRMTRFLAEQLGKSHWFSCDKARKELGYTPIVDSQTGLNLLIQHFAR